MREHVRGLYSVQTDLNIKQLKETCYNMYQIILSNFSDGEISAGHSGLHKNIFERYNFLLYPLPGIHELHFEIRRVFHEAIYQYFNEPVNKNWFIQCWLNFYFKDEYIDWHNHDWNVNRPKGLSNAWHGFLCVDTEPDSRTLYKWKNVEEVIDIESKDGLMTMGISDGDLHRSSTWMFSRPRITIAFDIVPRENITLHGPEELTKALCNDPQNNMVGFKNHWIPF